METVTRRTRMDALPENTDYADGGCDLYPSCLRCPLPRCRYDEPGGAAGMLRTGRDSTILRLAGEDGVSVDSLAEMFGLPANDLPRPAYRSRWPAGRLKVRSGGFVTIRRMQTWSLVDGRWEKGEAPGASARWHHVGDGGADELQALAVRYGLHPLSIEDCLSTLLHTPKIDEFSDHIFIVVAALVKAEGPDAMEEIDIFLGRDFLISWVDHAIPEVAETIAALDNGVTLRPGADGLLYELLDRVVDGILPEVHLLAELIEGVEGDVLAGREQATVSHRVVGLRAQAGRIRRLLSPQISVIQRLSRGEFAQISSPNAIYFRDVYDHMIRVDLTLESVREDAEVVLSTYLSAMNNRMNEVMKVLSVVAALALPATVISGVFGTNFDNVPGLHSNWGFVLMIGGMATLASGMAFYFRRRGWF
jgi:magnesium transporter